MPFSLILGFGGFCGVYVVVRWIFWNLVILGFLGCLSLVDGCLYLGMWFWISCLFGVKLELGGSILW